MNNPHQNRAKEGALESAPNGEAKNGTLVAQSPEQRREHKKEMANRGWGESEGESRGSDSLGAGGDGERESMEGGASLGDGGESGGENPLSKLKVRRAIYPVIIGIVVVGYMLYRDFDVAVFNNIHLTLTTLFWLFIALLCMVGRDLGYIIRIRVLSGGRLNWLQAFRVIMLWEFTSAITPSAIGGTSLAIVFVHKEGITVGRSSSIVMITSFLDELYFIIMFPLIILIAGLNNVFYSTLEGGLLAKGLMTFAIVGYLVKLVYLLILSYGLFINPRGLKWMMMKIFRWKPLRRWYRNMNNVGTEIINSSKEMKREGFLFWLKASSATFLSWTSRFFVANALIVAFFSVSDHLLLFSRQLVMWIMMLIMPTPGGSGFAEVIFSNYCSDLIEVPLAMQIGAATLIALLWRLITYYPYLIIGAVILPRWIRDKFGAKK